MRAPQLYTDTFNISPVEERRLCINGTLWIWHLLEECVENAWEFWSVVTGLISIVCFLFAALPQIYVTCRNGRVDQALSLGFLMGWLAGDLTDLTGCYLTNQLPIQIVTAIFYVNMDIIMISQFDYYKLRNQKMPKYSTTLKNFCISWSLVCVTLHVILPCWLLLRNQDQSIGLEARNRSLDMMEMSGLVCGYISCVFYLGNRFPQLYKNKIHRRQLLCAVCISYDGKWYYGLSLLWKMPPAHLSRPSTSYTIFDGVIGGFGVLFLDIFVTLQFVRYRQQSRGRGGAGALGTNPCSRVGRARRASLSPKYICGLLQQTAKFALPYRPILFLLLLILSLLIHS